MGGPTPRRRTLVRRLSLDLLLSSGFDSVHALLTQQCTLPALLCRDPADQRFIEWAAAGRADFLVTGDKDLLDISGPGRAIVIVSVSADDFLGRVEPG